MPRRISVLAGLCLLFCLPVAAEAPTLESEDDKTLYALGLALSQRLRSFGLEPAEITLIEAGLRDGLLGREPRVDLQAYGPGIDGYLQSRLTRVADEERAAGKQFLEKVLQEPGARQLESGTVYFEQEAGTGATPTETSLVKVHYQGTFRDGTVFDSSRETGEPADFAVNAVVPCFSEGIRQMRVGGKSRLVCPPEAAYGDAGYPPLIPPGTTLIFEIELVEVGDDTETDEPATP